ncbi:ubiquitin associated and SH3 domain-containing protein B, putative [Ixodes scapularis]|uniref:Ecdysteroid-phosphate phosphatase n=1 Tax=Ixodes scapularis TaxID=6945 RepID=B7Q9W0_IXOSC|nr:ubiquitin associated and SH3 domain-containing protein B, putative [Ixodes scapularis]|eukprot:XP_002406382.1 ubiquitin associated and SH3 domain-containing protein B, putative [Ixodes scapularis]
MADPPPRRNVGSRPHRQHLSPMQVLLQMGFPKHRAEKALAATGDRGVQLAADWLLAHVNDPTLDDSTPREYILYLCPVGPLLEQLQKFFLQSMLQCGRNGAHNYLPHITLCSFFQAPDDGIAHLTRALQHVVDKLKGELPDHIKLEHYTSQTFLGLFVAEEHNDVLKKLAVQFMREVSEFSIQVEPYLKALHITLAYQFQLEHYSVLEQLSQSIDTSASACWELRLYSRDTRIKGSEVHKVLYSHVPKEPDELELLIGDFVYVSGEHLGAATDGWVEGTSWLTGSTGFLPKNYIERTAESDAWTLHRSITIAKNVFLDGLDNVVIQRRVLGASQAPPSPQLSPKPQPAEREDRGAAAAKENIYENLGFLAQKASLGRTPGLPLKGTGRRTCYPIIVDKCYFITPSAFLGKYTRRDLNMPMTVPERKGGYQDYAKDSPLTNIGLYQATLTGNAMYESGVTFSHVYSSPSLRCIQTCTNILTALHFEDVPINVEPGLFEWLAWYPEGTPIWMTPAEFKSIGYHVNTEYKPLIEAEDLGHKKESIEQYYVRSFYVAQNLLKKTASEGGNVLLVGHAATLDTCTRQLTGRTPRSAADLVQLVHKIPYCGLCVAQESEGGWSLVAPPTLPLTHSANTRFDWRSMLSA